MTGDPKAPGQTGAQRTKITTADMKVLAVGSTTIGTLSGVAQFLASDHLHGLPLFGLSAVVVILGASLIVIVIRFWHAGARSVTLPLNKVVTVAMLFGVLGGALGWTGHRLREASTPNPLPGSTELASSANSSHSPSPLSDVASPAPSVSDSVPNKTVSNPEPRPVPQNTISTTFAIDPKDFGKTAIPHLTLKSGQTVRVGMPKGQWNCATFNGESPYTGVEGDPNHGDKEGPNDHKLFAVPDVPICLLIGKSGKGRWQPIGAMGNFTADDSGPLYLTANDIPPEACPYASCYSDNVGSITVRIEYP